MEPGFPDVIELAGTPRADVAALVADRRDELVARCERAGALLLRGLPIREDYEFDAVVGALGLDNFSYDDSLSNAVRVNRTPRVFTANEAPPEVDIPLHHELAQTPRSPSRLAFFCERAPDAGGATPLCRSDRVVERLAELEPAFLARCEADGLRYTHEMPAESDRASGLGRSWPDTLGVRTRAEAEERLAGLGYTWAWQAGGGCRVTTPVLPAVRRSADGRRTFFNQLIAATRGWKDARNDPRRAVTFGDGGPLDERALGRLVEVADALTFDLQWQTGDVALVDNLLVMHGRRPYGGERSVLASLLA